MVLGISNAENKSKHKLLHRFPLSKSTVYLIFFFGLNCKSNDKQKKGYKFCSKFEVSNCIGKKYF